MVGGDGEDIPLARFAQRGLDVTGAVHAIRRYNGEGHFFSERSRNHSAGKLRLRCEAHLVRHMRRLQAVGIVRPLLRRIKLTIDEGLAVARHIGSKHADLAIGDLARRARVLARHPARHLGLLQEAGLVDDQNGVFVGSASSAYSRMMSRNASASHRPRPRIAC